MRITAAQDRALVSASEWFNNSDQQVFRLFGYAGTGKTTLAKYFAEDIPGRVLYGAFSGKAAHVLRERGCEGASTIHSLIYHTKDKGQRRLRELELALAELIAELRSEDMDPEESRKVHELRRDINLERKSLSQPHFTLNSDSEVKESSLVIIDECSMVDERMGTDLLRFGTKVLVLGDPAQLPPIGGGGFFTEGVKPDIMLTEIHRQARDNPIIDLATRTRAQESIPLGRYGSSLVVDRSQWSPEEARAAALECDQILVGRNATRMASNRRMRALKGIVDAGQPVVGDRLVCLRNNHDMGLLNGAVWVVEQIHGVIEDRIFMDVRPGTGGEAIYVEAHIHHFQSRASDLPWWERKEANEFDYGYAFTVHKAQGSQWGNVLLFDESGAFRQDRWRWLYTAITRAADSITIAR